ncbi:MAG TPA: pantoate--beta-alanine ligase [Acidobacteriaceae bacterium]
MERLTTIAAMRAARRQARAGGQSLGLVPTMGALHRGHLSLVRAARATCDQVTVSIFVNPLQFGPTEDFARYPRTPDADCALLAEEGVDFVFSPSVEEMYPQGATTLVHVGGIGDRLDGASRPGHFDGVATVVAKLFHIVEPERAFFGQKDAAQLAVLCAMVRDLDFGLELVACPTVREADGLALSSRNRYLSPEEREEALVLSRALAAVETLAAGGERRAGALVEAAMQLLSAQPRVRVDYVAAVDAGTLEPVAEALPGTLFAIAAWVGATRLIDNVLLG